MEIIRTVFDESVGGCSEFRASLLIRRTMLFNDGWNGKIFGDVSEPMGIENRRSDSFERTVGVWYGAVKENLHDRFYRRHSGWTSDRC